MKGEHICFRKKLFNDPRSKLVASKLNIPVLHFVGCLLKLWGLGQDYIREDGILPMTMEEIDRDMETRGE